MLDLGVIVKVREGVAIYCDNKIGVIRKIHPNLEHGDKYYVDFNDKFTVHSLICSCDDLVSIGEEQWRLNKVVGDYNRCEEYEEWEEEIGVFKTFEELKDEMKKGYKYTVEQLKDYMYV